MSGLVRYPVPLGGGEFGYLYLPVVVTETDAARVMAYIQTLILPEVAMDGGDRRAHIPSAEEET